MRTETMDSETVQVNANSSSRKKVKRIKHKKRGQGVLDKSETDQDQGLPQEVESVNVESSSVEKKEGEAKNKSVAQEVVSSHVLIKKMDTESEVANAVVTSSSKKKKRVMRNKRKRGDGVVDASAKDPQEEMVIAQQKSSLMAGISEVEAEQPKRDLCPQSLNELNKEMDTESNQGNEELSSSTKRKKKKKKQKTVGNQDLEEQVVIVQPKSDLLNTTEIEAVQPKRDQCTLSPNDLHTKVGAESDHVEAEQPKRDLRPQSLNELNKEMYTESNQGNEELSSSTKRKKKKKKQKAVGNQDPEEQVVIVQPKSDLLITSEIEAVQPKRDQCPLSPNDLNTKVGTESDPVEAEQPKRDLCPQSLNELNKEMDTESNQGNEELSSSTKRKKNKKKQKTVGNQDPKEQVVIVQPKSDLLNTSEIEAVQPKRDQCLLSPNDLNTKVGAESDHVEAEQPKRDLCPQSLNELNKEMDTESNQGNEELSSSTKRKKKKKKQKTVGNQDLEEQVVIVQPKSDLLNTSEIEAVQPKRDQCTLSPNDLHTKVGAESDHVEAEQPKRDLCHQSLNELNKEMCTESNQGNEELSSSTKRKKKKRKQKIVDNQDLEEQMVIVLPKSDLLNTSEIEAVQPKRDQYPLFPNDLNTEVGAESDHVTAELSSSKKKRKKLKRQNDGKSDKDHLLKVVNTQPKSDLLLPSPEVSSLKNENTLDGEALQPKRDLCSASSTDFKKMDKESDQGNPELCSSSKSKRKREKQKKGDNILGKSYKDHDLAEEVIVEPKVEVAELGSKKDSSLMLDKQSRSLKDENMLNVEDVQQNVHPRPPSSNGSIKEMKTGSDQVNAELSPPNKRKRKRKKQKEENNVPDNSDKVQDLAEEVRESIQDMAEVGLGLKSESKVDKITEDCSTKKLLILDINGLLADIVSYGGNLAYKPDTIISRKAVFKRPFCDDFLQFCFEKFNVAVWSSRTRANVDSAVRFLMTDYRHKLVFCWDQSHCTHTKFYTLENNEKPLVLKELKKVWEKGEYNESNTLLVDDSPYKALRNPAYTAIFPQPYSHTDANDISLGPGGNLRVYLEGLSKADNTQKYVEENPIGQERITDTNQHWDFYSKILQIN